MSTLEEDGGTSSLHISILTWQSRIMFNISKGGPSHFVAVSFFGFFPTKMIGSAGASYPQPPSLWSNLVVSSKFFYGLKLTTEEGSKIILECHSKCWLLLVFSVKTPRTRTCRPPPVSRYWLKVETCHFQLNFPRLTTLPRAVQWLT